MEIVIFFALFSNNCGKLSTGIYRDFMCGRTLTSIGLFRTKRKIRISEFEDMDI